jgi:hypothetical protein
MSGQPRPHMPALPPMHAALRRGPCRRSLLTPTERNALRAWAVDPAPCGRSCGSRTVSWFHSSIDPAVGFIDVRRIACSPVNNRKKNRRRARGGAFLLVPRHSDFDCSTPNVRILGGRSCRPSRRMRPGWRRAHRHGRFARAVVFIHEIRNRSAKMKARDSGGRTQATTRPSGRLRPFRSARAPFTSPRVFLKIQGGNREPRLWPAASRARLAGRPGMQQSRAASEFASNQTEMPASGAQPGGGSPT